jgi:phospholipid/cholesterol/gamma-HCH transport system substrate-binding protein
MGNNLSETLVGAVVIIVAIGFVIYGYSVADVGTVRGYEIRAKFNRVDGLTTGADVRVAGIKVGTVVGEELVPNSFEALVLMNIAQDVKLPDDSSIKVAAEGLLGGSYLNIEPGGSDIHLKHGDEIRFTQGSVDIIGLFSQAVFSPGEAK